MSTAWIKGRSDSIERPIAELRLVIPWAGQWSAHVELSDLGVAPSGLVYMGVLGRVLAGQVVRGGQTKAGRTSLHVAGGSGELGKINPKKLAPKAYKNTRLDKILAELVRDSGESLTTLSGSVAARTLAHWPRVKSTPCMALDRVAQFCGLIWRVQLDGTIWVGLPTWESVAVSAKQIDDDPSKATTIYSLGSTFGPLPGQTLDGRRVSDVTYIVTASGEEAPGPGAFVCVHWYDSETDSLTSGQVARKLGDLVGQSVDTTFLRSYPGKVVSQALDGTLEVIFDDADMPSRKGVRYRALVDGARLSVTAGARCVVRFDGADPSVPVADLFDPGSATRGVARNQDTVNCGIIVFSTAGPGVLTGTYTPPSGVPFPFTLGVPIPLSGVINSASSKVFLP